MGLSRQQLRQEHDEAFRRQQALQAEYEQMQEQYQPWLEVQSARADALAREFKPLVQAAADAYANDQKELASQLASQRRAKQAKCESLNAEMKPYGEALKAKLAELKAARAKTKELAQRLKDTRWESGATVDAEPARGRADGRRVEALWGGEGQPDGVDHGHIVTNDGVNTSYVRYPGESKPVVDDEAEAKRRWAEQRGRASRWD